jgi:hypothetical protein
MLNRIYTKIDLLAIGANCINNDISERLSVAYPRQLDGDLDRLI